MKLKNVISASLLALSGLSSIAHADVGCNGKIVNINTYDGNENLYILLDSTSHYIGLSTEISKTIALTAFASNKRVSFYVTGASITSCTGGPANGSWDNGAMLNHYLSVEK